MHQLFLLKFHFYFNFQYIYSNIVKKSNKNHLKYRINFFYYKIILVKLFDLINQILIILIIIII